MRKVFYSIFIVFAVFLISCTTDKYIISDSADIHKYEFATIQNIMGYTGYPSLMDMDVKLYDALNESGIKMIGEKEIDLLSYSQKEKLLYVKYSATQNLEESAVSITFIDYSTLRPVANCHGSYSMGWSLESDMNHAVNNALEQLKLMWK